MNFCFRVKSWEKFEEVFSCYLGWELGVWDYNFIIFLCMLYFLNLLFFIDQN